MHPARRTGEILRRFARSLIERRVVQWLLAYLAGAWVLLEATSFLAGQFAWSPLILRLLLIVLAFGTLSALTLAWFHGEAGWQEVTVREAWIHGAIAAGLLATIGLGGLPEFGSGGSDHSPPLRRIAVLYFKDHSDAGEYAGLVQDLTEGVVHELTQVRPLDVLPLTAVAPYREEPDLDRVVGDLNVGALVEGSVTRSRDSLRVTAQLFEASGSHLGSWTWEGPPEPGDVAVGALARLAADSIRIELGRALRSRQLEAGAPDQAALRLYRQAYEIYEREALTDSRDDPEGALVLLHTADGLLAETMQAAPEWTPPYLLRAEIAEVRSRLRGRAEERVRSDLLDAMAFADRALQVGTDSTSALEVRGTLRFTLARHSPPEDVDSLLAAAEADLRTVYRLDPGRPAALGALSAVVDRQGKLHSAYEYARRAVEADAFLELGAGVYNRLIEAALQLERVGEADSISALVRSRFPVGQAHWQQQLLVLESLPRPTSEDIARAWEAADRFSGGGIVERQPERLALGHMMVAPVLARAGLADSAEAVIRDARRRLDLMDSRLRYAASYHEAAARLLLGQPDSALVLLRHHGTSYSGRLAWLASDWWFRELWDDPRFHELTGVTPILDP